MNYITARAVALTKYLIKRGLTPKEALEITIDKYIRCPKLNINKLIRTIKKEVKHEFYVEDEDYDIIQK